MINRFCNLSACCIASIFDKIVGRHNLHAEVICVSLRSNPVN